MNEPGDDHFSRAHSELGEPEAVFQISRRRFNTKLWAGVGLIAASLIGIVVLLFLGMVFDIALLAKIILTPLVFGIFILLHMYRQRGLMVLVYPTGLLRLRRGEVDSFPWEEIAAIRMKIQRMDDAGLVEIEYDDEGNPTACCLPVETPSVVIWKSWVLLERSDGAEDQFGPALADYDRLAELIQRRTFPRAWAEARDRLFSGENVFFGDLELSPDGLHHLKKTIAWRDVKGFVIAQGRLSIKKTSGWLPWLMLDVSKVPNPHVLFALIREAKRTFKTEARTPDEKDADESSLTNNP